MNDTVKVEDKATRLTPKKVQEQLDTVVENTNNAIGGLQKQIEDIGKTNTAILDFMKDQKKVPPVVIHSTHEAAEQDLGAAGDMDDGSPIVTGMFDINSPQFKDKERINRFMHEKVKVHIHESNNDLDVGAFFVSVNNKSVTFRFGETKVVPRYIIEQLARAKPVHYANVQKTGSDGVEYIANPGTRGLRYPFSVLQDDNPIGQSWLNVVLAQN